MKKFVYGPDNGWYYRIDTNANIERAYPASGRSWEPVSKGSSTYNAINDAINGEGAYEGRMLPRSSSRTVKKLLKKAQNGGRTASTPSFQPSSYTPPNQVTPLSAGAPAGGAQSGTSNVPALVGIGVGGLAVLGLIVYLASSK